MKIFCFSFCFHFLFLCFFLFPLSAFSTAIAKTAPVSVRLPEAKVWVGQRLPFFIELRAPGSFVGTASFDIPQLPGTIIIKIGTPVVSSEEIDQQSWFVQAHEFALFSQKAGILKIPQFPVRFSSRNGFTGPASDVVAEFPGMQVEIQQPPGMAKTGYVVTTEDLEISEKWTPEPGPVQAGAIFKRTIMQRASQLSGMALAPPPTTAPDTIRVYTENAVIQDKTERGAFLGERNDTLTYQLTAAGNFILPELTYVWWNPKTEKLQTKILPSVSFTVSPAASSSPATHRPGVSFAWLMLPLLVLAFAIWQRKKIRGLLQQYWRYLNPIDKVLANKLLHSCRQNDADTAQKAWVAWRNTQEASFQPGAELEASVLTLQRHIFGPERDSSWQGATLARAFAEHIKHIRAIRQKTPRNKATILPALNG